MQLDSQWKISLAKVLLRNNAWRPILAESSQAMVFYKIFSEYISEKKNIL